MGITYWLLAVGVLATGPTLPSPPQEEARPLEAELQKLVRLETPSARASRASVMARRKDVQLDEWLTAMRAFGTHRPAEAGSRVERAALRVGDEVEDTELHLVVPESYEPGTPAPLLLAFHGTGGDGSYMASLWAEVAERTGMIVVAPSEAGPNGGYAFSQRERDAALAALRWARLEFDVDEDAIFATGISRGGHLSWDLALRYPGTLAGIAPMIGSPRVNHQNGQNNIRYLDNVLDLPIRDLQGVGDDPRMIFNLKFVFARLEEREASDAELFLQEGLGHSFRMNAVDWDEFFGEKRRSAVPTRVRRSVARKGEGRAYWVEVLETKDPVAENFAIPLTNRWKKADEDEQREILQAAADKRTALLDVRLSGPFRYEAKASKGIESFRLLLPPRAFQEGKALDVQFNGKRVRRRPKASKEVLLREFAERFDRRFLPVAEVVID